MTKIKYNGPSESINVEPYGRHARGTVKEYPDDFAVDLIATSRKQKFERVEADGGQNHRASESAVASTIQPDGPARRPDSAEDVKLEAHGKKAKKKKG
jgi:hypothetical protein